MQDRAIPDQGVCKRWPLAARIAGALVVVALVAALYAPSLDAPFVNDDHFALLDNPHIRQVWPVVIPDELPLTSRPVVALSFALNHAASGGHDRVSYRAVNIALHALSALLLMGIVAQTLSAGHRHANLQRRADAVAFAVGLLWAAHPIATETVIYITQRTEGAMALAAFATLYAAIRSWRAGPRRARITWAAASVAACAIGMGCKEVMVGVPVIVLLFDRALFAGSWRAALVGRRGYYPALAATWVVLVAVTVAGARHKSVGFDLSIGVWEYAKIQAGMLVHYLTLIVWPAGMQHSYQGATAEGWSQWLPQGVLIVGLLIASLWGMMRNRVWGVLGLACFIVLGPTSSFLPIVTEVGADRRMYLPLAAIVAGAVVVIARRLPVGRGAVGAAVALLAIAGAAFATTQRAATWSSAESLHRDTVAKQPTNHHAHHDLAIALHEQGRDDEAIAHLRTALDLTDERFTLAWRNLGVVCHDRGEPERALECVDRALALEPNDARSLALKADVLAALGRDDEARAVYDRVLAVDANHPSANFNRGNALLRQGRLDEAAAHYRRALDTDPGYARGELGLAYVAIARKQADEAERRLGNAIMLDTDLAEAHLALGNLMMSTNRPKRAAEAFVDLARLQPDNDDAHTRAALALSRSGDVAGALPHFERAVAIAPDNPAWHDNLGVALVRTGQRDRAAQAFRRALQLDPTFAAARRHLDQLTATPGQPDTPNTPATPR